MDLVQLENRIKGVSLVAWISLVLSIIALPIAVMAYNKTGSNLNEDLANTSRIVVDETKETTTNIGENLDEATEQIKESSAQAAARMELEARLIALRIDVAANTLDEQSLEDLRNSRDNFRAQYNNASGDLKTLSDSVLSNIDRLIEDIEDESAEALVDLDTTVKMLQNDFAEFANE